MKIVFWNTYKNININEYLVNLIIEHNCDIIVLAEYKGNEANLKNELYIRGYEFEEYSMFACKKIKIFYNKNVRIILNNDNSNYVSFKLCRNDLEFELFAVHFPSKLYESDDNRQFIARTLKSDIDKIENAVVVGDFNSNPFEKTMVAASCLSALPTINCINRTVQGNKIKILYNPMWKFFGDFEKFPGTYYYRKSEDINYVWNIFDQVLVSNNLLRKFNKESVRIIRNIKGTSLIKNQKIDKNISDHLPVFFSLKEDKDG